jgi:hypothetical protein
MQERSLEKPCWIGSVKTNIGHLEAAAGIAGLIKVVLSLHYGEIPPHLHLEQLNPYISLEGTPLSIPTMRQQWLGEKERRLAGVSSFGFGGTNAHVVLEEASSTASVENEVERPLHILTLSAKSEKSLREMAQRYVETEDIRSLQKFILKLLLQMFVTRLIQGDRILTTASLLLLNLQYSYAPTRCFLPYIKRLQSYLVAYYTIINTQK